MIRNFGNKLEKILTRGLPLIGALVSLTLATPRPLKNFVPEGKSTPSIFVSGLPDDSEDTRLGYYPFVEYTFYGTELAPKNSIEGRLQRTLRWAPIYTTIEQIYGIPHNTLAAVMMQESYGDPLQTNSQNDGGFGIVHIQRKTAKEWGMKVFGTESAKRNKMYSDTIHGKELLEMLDSCKGDFGCAQEKDDRAHIIYNLDVTARILMEGKRKYGSWDKGIEYLRSPAKIGEKLTVDYLKRVKIWRVALNSQKAINRAAEDFEVRNGYKMGDYLLAWYDMNNNWDLQKYRDLKLAPPTRSAQ